jgi:ABC-type polar amino acid transport system ATPase subunit/GNAT superfamily N-acetyltransferase
MSSTGALKRRISVSTPINRTGRVMQLEGIFDVPPAEKSAVSWEVELPIDDRDWNVGLIVGPSGSGKSTIARELWSAEYVRGFQWRSDSALVDDFPAEMSIKDITSLLNSVGFSSPPSWLRPFSVLSNGEQFRATIARAMAELPALAVIDEFTSVVDRRVAQIGSSAIAKTVRRRASKLVAVSCHYDIDEWLQPDWVYEPSENRFEWRSLRRRPTLELQISRVPHSAWKIFSHHHYLSAELNRSAACFCAFLDGRPVAFHSYLPFFGKLKDSRKAVRGHRSVCLPDFQGLGIGSTLITYLASMWAGLGLRVFRNTGHPAEIASAIRSADWWMIRAPGTTAPDTGRFAAQLAHSRASNRMTASFEYVGSPMPTEDADRLHSWST